MEKTMLMAKTRELNNEEKCELISALSNAAQNNRKKSKTFKSAAEDAIHKEDAVDLAATADRFELWGQLDESLIEAIRDGRVVIMLEEDGEDA